MARVKNSNQKKKNNGANVGYEAELWQMADALRGSMDAAEYKHVVLGLIFLKYISGAFEEQHAKLEAERAQGAEPEDPDEYRALNIFWVPPEARWSHLKAQAKQPTIAQLLGTLDDKIELNRRMNETLEAMARAIFKSWFVDFDPVRAKAGGRDPALPKHIADLFPDSFEDSELGEIPAGWHVSTLRELTSSIQYGLTRSAAAEPVGPKFLRITDIQGGRVDWGKVPYCNVSPEEYERYRLKAGDILVARTGASTGENIYLPLVPDAVFASYLVRFQFDDPVLARLIGAFMRTPPYFDFVEGSIGGSAQPNASAQVLAGAQFAVPTREIAWRFSELVGPLDRRMAANNDESRTLTALRDALLPKLLSGEIRITAAEKVIGEVA